MSDLISRKALLDRFRYGDVDTAHDKAWIAYVRTAIKKQPTAYDVDKVVERLDDYLFERYCVEGDNKWVEIVKQGGVSNGNEI